MDHLALRLRLGVGVRFRPAATNWDREAATFCALCQEFDASRLQGSRQRCSSAFAWTSCAALSSRIPSGKPSLSQPESVSRERHQYTPASDSGHVMSSQSLWSAPQSHMGSAQVEMQQNHDLPHPLAHFPSFSTQFRIDLIIILFGPKRKLLRTLAFLFGHIGSS